MPYILNTHMCLLKETSGRRSATSARSCPHDSARGGEAPAQWRSGLSVAETTLNTHVHKGKAPLWDRIISTSGWIKSAVALLTGMHSCPSGVRCGVYTLFKHPHTDRYSPHTLFREVYSHTWKTRMWTSTVVTIPIVFKKLSDFNAEIYNSHDCTIIKHYTPQKKKLSLEITVCFKIESWASKSGGLQNFVSRAACFVPRCHSDSSLSKMALDSSHQWIYGAQNSSLHCLAEKSGPYMITVLSLRTVSTSMPILMQLSVIWGLNDAK